MKGLLYVGYEEEDREGARRLVVSTNDYSRTNYMRKRSCYKKQAIVAETYA